MRKNSRLLSLDVFRGITIVLMILVNSPGNQTAYKFLNHSVWNGCTLADVVFPFFIFIVGVSLVFSLSKQKSQDISTNTILIKVIKRVVILFLIGLFLNAFPKHLDFDTLRIFGVLQRIAICYLIAAWLYLTTRAQTQAWIVLILLMGYWFLMRWVPVPGYGIGNLTIEGNLVGYIDRMIFSAPHLYEKIFDPEGILSTLPAIATILLGNLTGIGLLTQWNEKKKFFTMLFLGIAAIVAGWLWGLIFPINKALWTSSFVLWTGGLAWILLACCYGLIEIKHYRVWSKPFEIFGMNAIAAYFLHIFFLKIQAMIHIRHVDGSPGNLRFFMTEHLFGWATAKTASLLYALSYICFWLLILTILYRKKIFIRL